MNPFRQQPGAVYLIEVRDPATGRIDRRGYVGKTRRRVATRVAEHHERQTWGGAITGWRTIWRSERCTGLMLWWAEVLSIIVLRPLLNVQWNRLNWRRIPRYRQARHFRGCNERMVCAALNGARRRG